MTKDELLLKTATVKTETHDALQTLWDNINKGQRKQLLKRADVKALLDRYEVDYGDT